MRTGRERVEPSLRGGKRADDGTARREPTLGRDPAPDGNRAGAAARLVAKRKAGRMPARPPLTGR